MLVECPECGKQVSDKAPTCPSCGVPITESNLSDSSESTDSPFVEAISETLVPRGASRYPLSVSRGDDMLAAFVRRSFWSGDGWFFVVDRSGKANQDDISTVIEKVKNWMKNTQGINWGFRKRAGHIIMFHESEIAEESMPKLTFKTAVIFSLTLVNYRSGQVLQKEATAVKLAGKWVRETLDIISKLDTSVLRTP